MLPLAIEAKLAGHGFKTVEPDASLSGRGILELWHRKTWNTNRGAVLAEPRAVPVADFVERMRYEAGPFLGSSWFSQLGLQVILNVDGARLPTEAELAPLVDAVNTQGILIQSVFAIDPSTGSWSQARTWGSARDREIPGRDRRGPHRDRRRARTHVAPARRARRCWTRRKLHAHGDGPLPHVTSP